MAIYHLSVETGSRNGGQSAVAKIKYICKRGKYARPGDAVILVESGYMPAWATQSSKEWARLAALGYWSAADRWERKNGRLFKEVEFALPDELGLEQNLALARRLIRELTSGIDGGNLPFVFAVHAKESAGGSLHHLHVHAVISERVNDGVTRSAATWFLRAANSTGPLARDTARTGARKTLALRPDAWLDRVRRRWQVVANEALADAGCNVTIDHRSLADQGIVDRTPEHKIGPFAVAIERAGGISLNAELVRAGRATKKAKEEADAAVEAVRRLEKELQEELEREARAKRGLISRLLAEQQAALAARELPVALMFIAVDDAGPEWNDRLRNERRLPRHSSAGELPGWTDRVAADGCVVYQRPGCQLIDAGSQITAASGNDDEIEAMVMLAQLKGWNQVALQGAADFKERAMRAACAAGLGVVVRNDQDREILARVESDARAPLKRSTSAPMR